MGNQYPGFFLAAHKAGGQAMASMIGPAGLATAGSSYCSQRRAAPRPLTQTGLVTESR